MKIEANFYPAKNPMGKYVGQATIVLSSEEFTPGIKLTSIRVMQGDYGYWLAPPSRSAEIDGKTEYFDYFYPLNGDLRQAMTNAVIDQMGDIVQPQTVQGNTNTEDADEDEVPF